MSIIDILKMLLWALVVAGTVFALTKSIARLFQVASGLLALGVYNSIFDLGVWPIIQNMFGTNGVVGLTLGALILNLITLSLYQKYSKTDWLGITIVDDIILKHSECEVKYAESKGAKRIWTFLLLLVFASLKQIIVWKWIPFIGLSLMYDSFVATAYYLHWKNKSVNISMSKGDYIVFTFSTILGCVAWAFFTEWITLPAFKNLWSTFA